MAEKSMWRRIPAAERFSVSCWRLRAMRRTVPIERTIYVLDDDAAVRRSLEQLLEAAGFRAVSFETPTTFLHAAPDLAPGCVLLDIRIPDMDGLELQGRMNDLGIALPVIIMTGQGDVQ